jgi:hypothetical protein
MTTLTFRMVVARKDHRCSCCKQTILKGTTYLKCVTVDGGDFQEWKAHNRSGHCGKEIVDCDGEGTFCERCDPYV